MTYIMIKSNGFTHFCMFPYKSNQKWRSLFSVLLKQMFISLPNVIFAVKASAQNVCVFGYQWKLL